MKVAIIINTSWNIYNFRKGLIQFLLDRGDEVVTIAPRDEYTKKLVAIGCEFVPMEMSGTGMNVFSDIGLFFSLKKILKEVRPSIILTYTIKPNIYGSIAAGQLNIPSICNVSGLGTVFLRKRILRMIATQLYTFSFRFNKWVFFQNDEDRDDFLFHVKMNAHKTSLLPGSGINISEFEYSSYRQNEKTVFLMISRLIVEKGVRDYIDAIKIIKKSRIDVIFRLVGNLDSTHKRSITREELDSWIKEGLIEYQEHLPDVRKEIALANVVVLPSYREGTPRTLLEGGALGRALLASDVPGCRHVVKHGENGFLFEAKNPTSLVEAIKCYLNLSDESKLKMSLESRKIVEKKFDERIVIEKYNRKIEELLS